MKVVDANVLLYAVNRDAPQNQTARSWLDQALSGPGVVGFPWVVLLAFLRISTHPSIFSRPLSTAEAFDTVEAWLSQPSTVIVEVTGRHLSVLRGLLESTGTAGNLVNDAHLAALTAELGAEVVTFDTDFARFDGVRLHRLR